MKRVYSPITAALAATAIASTSAADNLYVDADTVRKVQETLNARGYKAGAPNGILGESTRSALRAFQKSENIVVTGSLNPRTLARLGINDPRAASGGSRSRNSN